MWCLHRNNIFQWIFIILKIFWKYFISYFSEVGRILPAEFGIFRTSEVYSPHKDIRKNLAYFQDLMNEVPTVTAYVFLQYSIIGI